jgi:mono/diheme cytochrome c family protein
MAEMYFKSLRNITVVLSVAVAFSSCNRSPEHPGYIYFPDMTYSEAYESYTPNPNFEDGMSARQPVPGTISRGYIPFHFANTTEDYERAGTELTNPIPLTMDHINQGKYYYEIYCAVCHGNGGEGDGSIVQREKFPAPPSFFNDYMMDLSDGKMFFSVHYGKGIMGSYASQLSQERRWKIIAYINQLQGQQSGNDQNGSAAGESQVDGEAPASTPVANEIVTEDAQPANNQNNNGQ